MYFHHKLTHNINIFGEILTSSIQSNQSIDYQHQLVNHLERKFFLNYNLSDLRSIRQVKLHDKCRKIILFSSGHIRVNLWETKVDYFLIPLLAAVHIHSMFSQLDQKRISGLQFNYKVPVLLKIPFSFEFSQVHSGIGIYLHDEMFRSLVTA